MEPTLRNKISRNPRINDFINSKNIALLGASPSGRKFGNYIYKQLRAKGYNLYPVHPQAESIEQDKAYDNIRSLPDGIDAVLIAMAPDKALDVIGDAAQRGIKRIWFQRGADFRKAAQKAEAAGIEVVTGKCILMYAPPVKGFHAIHRALARLFGRL
jgi:predicted CoA-binding protein